MALRAGSVGLESEAGLVSAGAGCGRKIELGPLFFEPRVLRAIVTYNAAQLERVTDAILDAGDWGIVEVAADAESASEPSGTPVFESRKLRRIAAGTTP